MIFSFKAWALGWVACLAGSAVCAADPAAMNALCDKVGRVPMAALSPASRVLPDRLMGLIQTSTDAATIRQAIEPDHIDRPRGPSFLLTPLAFAASRGSWVAVQVLLDSGARIDAVPSEKDDATALEMAIHNRQYPIACQLIRRGAKLPTPADHVYLVTSASGAELEADFDDSVTLVGHLLDHGYPIDGRWGGPPGDTALMVAAEAGNVRLAEELLRRGADPRLRNGRSETPLMIAVRAGQPQVAKRLRRWPKTLR